MMILLAAAITSAPAEAATIFNTRAAFQAGTGVQLVDDYENPNYQFTQSDAAMSAVLGQTTYQSLTYTNLNVVADQSGWPSGKIYCAGCNGGFLLTFTNTLVDDATGVFGVGFDLVYNERPEATVTFGDDSSAVFGLPSTLPFSAQFWGITDARNIRSISMGVGQLVIEIDNLTLASASEVPEPAAWPLLAAAAGAAWTASRRRATSR